MIVEFISYRLKGVLARNFPAHSRPLYVCFVTKYRIVTKREKDVCINSVHKNIIPLVFALNTKTRYDSQTDRLPYDSSYSNNIETERVINSNYSSVYIWISRGTIENVESNATRASAIFDQHRLSSRRWPKHDRLLSGVESSRWTERYIETRVHSKKFLFRKFWTIWIICLFDVHSSTGEW